MAGLTEQLAAFVASLDYERVPLAGVETVKRGVIDCLGVMFAGRDDPLVGIVMSMVRQSPAAEARLLFDRGRTVAGEAALVNGIAAHILDYDDVALDGHPSVVLVPAILAEGERLGADGRALIAAYVAGYETWAELRARDADKHHAKGWHPTAVFGTVAAAAAASRLARLDAKRTQCALGLAASMAGGIVANFGSMTKALQVGRAAQNGILAARLAAEGVTASADALEHPYGFLHAISPAGRVRAEGAIQAGADWHIVRHGLNVKRYPVCYAVHRAIDAALDLRARHGIEPQSIASVEVTLGRTQAVPLREHRPVTPLQAKFSAEFAMASALIAGRVGMAELTEPFIAQPEVRSLMTKVQLAYTDERDPEDSLVAPCDHVRIALANGAALESAPVRYARGHARNPITVDELLAKFVDCIDDALPASRRDALADRLRRLEALQTVASLY